MYIKILLKCLMFFLFPSVHSHRSVSIGITNNGNKKQNMQEQGDSYIKRKKQRICFVLSVINLHYFINTLKKKKREIIYHTLR